MLFLLFCRFLPIVAMAEVRGVALPQTTEGHAEHPASH
jgi:hypothetical protein